MHYQIAHKIYYSSGSCNCSPSSNFMSFSLGHFSVACMEKRHGGAKIYKKEKINKKNKKPHNN